MSFCVCLFVFSLCTSYTALKLCLHAEVVSHAHVLDHGSIHGFDKNLYATIFHFARESLSVNE